MAGASLPLAFGALVAGAIVIDYGVKAIRPAFANSGSSASDSVLSGAAKAVAGFPASVNPLPGATGSRLDQGIDATGKKFLSPWTGTVEVSNARDSGWRGGGYVAVRSSDDPSQVYYLAEGITPIVRVGQRVTAGQSIALPVANPYNGIIGNIEAGLANPHNPRQPLAQVVKDSAGMVQTFYAWLEGLGGPKATSTAMAGRA